MKAKTLLADITKVRVFFSRGELLVWATGSTPSPGFSLDFEQSLLHAGAPAFVLRAIEKPGAYAEDKTPFAHWETFGVGEKPAFVRVFHQGGESEVAVEDARVNFTTLIRKLLCNEEPLPDEQVLQPSEPPGTIFVGSSKPARNMFSASKALDEAFADALGQIPKEPILNVRVIEITASVGGVAGMSQMFVKLRKG